MEAEDDVIVEKLKAKGTRPSVYAKTALAIEMFDALPPTELQVSAKHIFSVSCMCFEDVLVGSRVINTSSNINFIASILLTGETRAHDTERHRRGH
jgi:hypothetical protein